MKLYIKNWIRKLFGEPQVLGWCNMYRNEAGTIHITSTPRENKWEALSVLSGNLKNYVGTFKVLYQEDINKDV